MAVLFKTWLERAWGRFLLGRFWVRPDEGLTGLSGLEIGESNRSGDEFCGVSRDYPLFIRRYYADIDLAVRRRNSRCIAAVCHVVEAQTEPSELRTNQLPYRRAPFADAAGEHQGVESTQRGGQ